MEREDLSDKIQAVLDKAIQNVIAETELKNSYMVIADETGTSKKIPAKDV